MARPTRLFFFIVFAALIFPLKGFSQYGGYEAPPSPPDVLSPSPRYWMIGPLLGLNINSHPGDFVPMCHQCNFADGTGKGILIGMQIEKLFSSFFGIALKVYYDDKRAEYTSSMSPQWRYAIDNASGMRDSALIPVERNSKVQLAYFMLNPMLEFFPIKNLYLHAGPAVGLTVVNTYEVKERLLEDNYVYYFSGTNEETLEKTTEIRDINSFRFDIRAGIGYNIRLSYNVMLSPEVLYEFPLTRISSDDNWEAQSIHAFAVLKIAL